MAATESLDQVLADERGKAAVLHAYGQPQIAALILALCDRVAAAAESYLRFCAESEAMLRTGKARGWLRARRDAWAAAGHARKVGGTWEYRECVLPEHTPASIAREAGRRGERLARRAS